MDRERLEASGKVLEAGGVLLAYTFGTPVSADSYCILAEIAQREPPGLAQTLFREFCREIETKGYRWVNAMGDAGLPSLRRAKMAYRPASEETVFTAS